MVLRRVLQIDKATIVMMWRQAILSLFKYINFVKL